MTKTLALLLSTWAIAYSLVACSKTPSAPLNQPEKAPLAEPAGEGDNSGSEPE
jgi:hypothetical protein